MKSITPLIESYAARKKKLAGENLKEPELLKEKIRISKCFLHKVRLHLRNHEFSNIEDEIHFFKFTKPQLCGELLFYNARLSYLSDKPDSTVCREISYIKSGLKKLETKKRKNISFYRYCKHAETAFDDKYFIRNDGQFNLFNSEDALCSDPEFNTSHSNLASEVVAYRLQIEFYKKELLFLKSIDKNCPETIGSNVEGTSTVNCTASKSDIVELLYGLKCVGAINNGNIEIKELAVLVGRMFNIPLGDVYGTFNDIRSRKINQTKFLDKLKESLIQYLKSLDK